MSTSRPSAPPADATYSKMSVGDVEAIGSHCQMPFCHQLDFLPFKCESCKGKFCLDHRTETSHRCPQAGDWARRRAQLNQTPTPILSSSTRSSTPKPNILTHEQQCSHPSCKALINTPLTTGVHCEKCQRSYCLKHRSDYSHSCKTLPPLRPTTTTKTPQQTQREKGLEALSKLRAWGASKNPIIPPSKTKAAALARTQNLAQLKRNAKGDPTLPPEKRIYLHVEASSDHAVSAKIPKGDFFYSADYTVGRMLDLAAKSLAVANVNNRSESEGDKLRVFHVEGGRLLGFGEKLGGTVEMGDTVVLIRGEGEGMVGVP